MFPNPLIFAVAGGLVASCFLVPKLFRTQSRLGRIAIVIGLYISVFTGFLWLDGLKTAIAVIELGLVFAVIGELLVLNYRMVHTPEDPKHRRCY